jgi:hypothetical protein
MKENYQFPSILARMPIADLQDPKPALYQLSYAAFQSYLNSHIGIFNFCITFLVPNINFVLDNLGNTDPWLIIKLTVSCFMFLS